MGPQPIGPGLPLFTGVALIALGLALGLAHFGGVGLVALGIVLGIIGALSIPLRKVKVSPRPPPGSGSVALPALLGALPLVLLGLASIRAAVFELVYAQNGEYVLLIVFGLFLQVVGWGVYVFVCKGAPKEKKTPWLASSRWPLPVAAVTSAAVALGTWLDPWRTGDVAGTIGVLVGFLIAVTLLGYGARLLEIRSLAPPFFLVLGIRRFPIFLIVAAWAVVAAIADPGGYHNVRTIDRAAGAPVTLTQAWERWLGQQPDGNEAVPLVLVAAEGGGIRAAYWAARALDCVIDADVASCGYEADREPGDPGSIFAASGISGGSLGLVAHAAAVRQGDRSDWVDKRLGDDFLAAAGAWMLFTDLPNSLLKLDIRPDRAGVLERAWQNAWGADSPLADGLLATWTADPKMPLLLLSGTSVQDGCRVNNSVLDADVEEVTTVKALRARDCLSMGAFASDSKASLADSAFAATHDLFDLLCETKDVRLSTAALLSARFPWVSPAGRIPRCGTSFATYAVDGGYFDTSAASPIQELWARLEPLIRSHNQSNAGPCVVPVLLQLDNHYKEPRNPGATGRPWEAGVPLAAVRAARDARENDARQAAALLFSTFHRRRRHTHGRRDARTVRAPVSARAPRHLRAPGLGALTSLDGRSHQPTPRAGEPTRVRQDPPLVLRRDHMYPIDRVTAPRRVGSVRPNALRIYVPCASMRSTSSSGGMPCASTRIWSRLRRRRSCSRFWRRAKATATPSSSGYVRSPGASSSGPTGCSIRCSIASVGSGT